MVAEKDFEFVDKHSRSHIGEVDYVYYCKVTDHILWKVSPMICIECKNWNETISSEKMNHFINLVREKSPFSSCGVYITSSSFSKHAKTAIRDARIRDKIIIIPVERKQLNELINFGFKGYILKLCMKTVLDK
jgi:restriction endonuclease Mrr